MNRNSISSFLALLLIGLVLVAAKPNSVHGQGKLDRIRKVVRTEKPAKPKKSKRDGSKSKKSDREKRNNDRRDREPRRLRKRSRNNNGNSGFGFVISSLIAPTVEEVHVIHHIPTSIPSATVVIDQPETVYQPVVAPVAYPVAAEETPIFDSDYFQLAGPTFDWGIRLTAFGGTDFDGVTVGNLGLLLQIPGGLGIDCSVAMLRESGSDFRDHLYLGDANLVYEPIYSDFFRMRFGIGINWLGDTYGGDSGFNMTCGFDLKLTERWIATGEVDYGSIGDTDLTHAQISLGRAVSARTEWTIGYDFRDIGGVKIDSAFTGLRFRF